MDLRQLRHFVSVAEELHFGRAAQRLGMTQPPLSQSIQMLEEELGVRLFERTKRSVTLTAVGAQWLPHARKVLEDAAALPGIAARLGRGEIGALRLAFVSIADYNVLPILISRYKALYPHVDVSLKEKTSDLQIEALLNGSIDAGLVIPPPQPAIPSSLTYKPLVREPLIAAVPAAWLKSGRIAGVEGMLSLKEILGEPLILFPRRSAPALHDAITHFYSKNGANPRIGQEAIQMQTIISLVSAGLGIALVPQSLKNLGRTGVQYLAFKGKPPAIETGLIWRSDATLPALKRFVEVASQIIKTPHSQSR